MFTIKLQPNQHTVIYSIILLMLTRHNTTKHSALSRLRHYLHTRSHSLNIRHPTQRRQTITLHKDIYISHITKSHRRHNIERHKQNTKPTKS